MVGGGGHASGHAVLVSSTIFCALAGILTIARLYTRWRITANVGIDDWLVAVAMVSEHCLRSTLDSANAQQLLAVLLTLCMGMQGISHVLPTIDQS